MNAPDTYRAILRGHVEAVEAQYPLKIVGILPPGSTPHVFGEDPLSLLAEKRNGLSLFGIAGAEVDLSDRLKRPVGILMVSELSGREAVELPASATPL